MMKGPNRPNQLNRDEDAIRKWVHDYTDTWNKHDAKALALLFAADLDFVGGSGGLIRGRSQFERVMAEEYSTTLKERKLTNTIDDIRFLKPDIAIVNGTYQAVGIGSQTQAAPLKGLYTVIMGKKGRKWVGLSARSIVR